MSLSSPILTSDFEGVKFAKLQRLFRAIADAASISYTMAFPLTDINVGDTEGVKWAKLGAWSQLIANNISGGGGGGVTQLVAGAGIGLSPVGGTGVVTVTNTGGAPGTYATAANNAGNTTVTATVPLYDLALTFGGAARTSILILDTTGRAAGDRVRVLATLPATAAIVIEARNATAGGTLLFPAELFPSQQFTTDGTVLSALWEFEFTGSAFRYVTSNQPA